MDTYTKRKRKIAALIIVSAVISTFACTLAAISIQYGERTLGLIILIAAGFYWFEVIYLSHKFKPNPMERIWEHEGNPLVTMEAMICLNDGKKEMADVYFCPKAMVWQTIYGDDCHKIVTQEYNNVSYALFPKKSKMLFQIRGVGKLVIICNQRIKITAVKTVLSKSTAKELAEMQSIQPLAGAVK